jgi:hypothetical protein
MTARPPIASGAAFAQEGVAWFGMDATLTDFRRRGAPTALINRRIENGRAAGLLGFTAETGQPPAGCSYIAGAELFVDGGFAQV